MMLLTAPLVERSQHALLGNMSRCMSALAKWATCSPTEMSASNPAEAFNLVNGEWRSAARTRTIIDPLRGGAMVRVPDTQPDETHDFVASLCACPKIGLHNPLKNPERYTMYGAVAARAAEQLRNPEIEDFFTRLIQRVAPKSYAQAKGEVVVTCRFLENFGGDQVRFTARGFMVAGDHAGQQSHGYRFPYGPVCLIAPFNFPLEIPALQMMGALFMGNKLLLHCDAKVSIVAEQFVRLLHDCGMPRSDTDMLHGSGTVMNHVMLQARPNSTLFTGSKRIAEKLSSDMKGKIFLEDAGFDWKIFGPDARKEDLDYVAWQSDQDAYACSGQKCSAQSIAFVHENWMRLGIVDAMRARAAKRNLQDLTIGPVLTWTTDRILQHTQRLLSIPGAKLLFGGKPLQNHNIPKEYGAVEPTAVFVPLKQILNDEHWEAVTTELFGPFQVVTEWKEGELDLVLQACEKMEQHLTAAVVSNDIQFVNHVLGHTVNGTTYAGLRARTTGAPQNHWFGPASDPRSAGIGTPEAIRLVWSTHREIIHDWGPLPAPSNLKQS